MSVPTSRGSVTASGTASTASTNTAVTTGLATGKANFLYPHQEVVKFVTDHQRQQQLQQLQQNDKRSSGKFEDSNYTDVNGIHFPHPRSSSMTIRRPKKAVTPTSSCASPWDAAGFYGMTMNRNAKSIYEGIPPRDPYLGGGVGGGARGGRRRSYTLSGGTIGSSWPSSRKW